MGNNNPNISYTINIDTYVRDITKDIKKQKRELVDFKSAVDNMNLGDEISKQIQQVIDELDKMQEKYVTNLKKFADSKLSTESFDKFTKKFNDDMSLISERMTKIESKVYDLSEKFSSVKGVDKLQDKFDKLQNKVDLLDGRIKNLMRDMKDTIKILKDFDSMTTMNNTSKGLKDINKTISKLNKVNVDKKGSSIFENDINKLKDSFVDTYERMTDLQDQLGKEKEPKAIRRLQDELVDTIELLEQTGKAIAEMTDGKSMLKTSASFTRKGFEYHVKDIAEEIVDLQDAESIIAKSLAKSKAGIIEIIEALNKEVTTSAESFKFKKGGIVIPVILDPNSKQFLEDETQKLVKVLNDYAELHPVNVTFRLFPMTGSKADVSSISKSMKEVRAEIEKIEEPELKARFSEFSDKLEKQYQQALKLRIAVEISQTADEVKRDIDRIKDVVKNAGIGSIDLTFDISDEEAEKIKLVYNKKVVGKIQSMANSLSKIFDVKTISDWSTQFRTALGQISDKLKIMQPLIQPLADLTLSQDIKKKRGRPKKDTLENKNIIDGFTKTMDLLNKSLAERSKAPKLNAEEFTQEIQNAIDKADIPVTVPVEPDTQGFIEQLEDRLKSVPVNVVVGNVIGGAVSGGAGAGIVVTGGNVTMENPTVDESGVKETKSKGGEKSTKQKQDSSSIFGVSKDFIKKEFANVSFDGKNKGVKKTDEEKKLTDAFYELYDSYKELMTSLPKITSGIEKAKERSEKLEREVSLDPLNKEKIKKSEEYNAALPEKLAERMKLLEENRAKIELIEKEFPSFKDSNFNSRRTRENLLKEFLKSKGIERTASLTPKQYLDNLKDEVTSKGSLSGTGAKKLINSIVDRFIGFEQLDLEAQMKKNDGHSVTELTKNATDEFNKLFTEYSHLANDAGKIGKEIETLRENKGYAYKKKIAEKQTELDTQNAKIDEFVKNNKVFSNVVPNKPLDEQKNKLLKKYINSKNIYKTRGMSITDLTDDSKAKNKLLKAYNKRLGIVDDNKKANEEYSDSSEKIARKSMFEGIATEELQKKYAELAKEKEKLSEYTSGDLLTDSTKDKEGTQSIIKSIDWLKKSNKAALDYKKKGLINGEGLSLDEAKKRGFTIQGDEIIDALTQEAISKDIIKGLVEKYGISEDMLKGINRKSKAKVEDLAKEILAHGKRKEMGKNIDNEMRQITTELSLREKEEEASKKAEEEAQKKNKKKKTESKETKIEATSADEASTDSINKESEALENNTNEQEKNNKVKKEKIDIAQQIRDKIAREKESGKIDTTGVPEEALEKILNATIKTAEEQGIGTQSSLEKYKYLLNFYKESKNAMLEGLQSGQDVGITQDVKDTQKKINAEKKETVNYDSMSEEELQKCLATEEKWLARCKEGTEAYNRRRETIDQIQKVLANNDDWIGGDGEPLVMPTTNTEEKVGIKRPGSSKSGVNLKVIPSQYVSGYVRSLDEIKEQLKSEGVPDGELDSKAQEIRKAEIEAISDLSDGFVRFIHRTTADIIDEIIKNGFALKDNYFSSTFTGVNNTLSDDQGTHKGAGSFVVVDMPEEYIRAYEPNGIDKNKLGDLKEQYDIEEKILSISDKIEKIYDDDSALEERTKLLTELLVLAKKYNDIVGNGGENSLSALLYGDYRGGDSNKEKYNSIEKIQNLLNSSKKSNLIDGYKEETKSIQKENEALKEITQSEKELQKVQEQGNHFQGLIDRINKYDEEKVKIGELKQIYKEYVELVDQLWNGEEGAPLYGAEDDDYPIQEFFARQLSKHGYKFDFDADDFVKGKTKFGFDSEDAFAIGDIANSLDKMSTKSKDIEKEKQEVSELIKELYRLKEIGDKIDDPISDEWLDNYNEQTIIANKLTSYLGVSQNPLDHTNPEYYAKQFAEKYAEGIESEISDAKEAGANLAKAAEEGTAEAQDSHSPSVVAEKLGEYWGIGYANGIKKHKNEVEDAVRELVNTGKLTAEDLQKDLDILLSGGFGNKYKALKDPLSNILASFNTDSSKTQVKQKQFLDKKNAEKKFKSAYDKYFRLRDKTNDSDEEVKSKAVEDLNKLLIQYPTLNSIGKEKKENVDYAKQLKSFLDTQTQLRKETDKATESTDKNTKSEQKNKQAKKENQKATEDLSKSESKKTVQVDRYLSKENATKDFKAAYDKYFSLREKTDDKSVNSKNKLLERFPTLKDIGNKKADEVNYDAELNKFLKTQTKLKEENSKATDKQADSVKKESKNIEENTKKKKENKKVTEDNKSKKEVQVDRYLNKDNATKAFEDAYNKYFDFRDKTDEKSVNSKNKLLERFPTLKDIGNKNKDEVKYADELNKFLQTQTKLKEANAKATDKQADAVKAETEEVRKNTEEKKKNNAEEKKNDSSVADTSSQIKSSSGESDKEKSGVTRTIKGVITRLNNSDELSKEQLDKADSTFAKWINKAKELGMDVSKFEQDFSSARAKFGESVEDSLGKIEEETRVEIKSLDDRRKEYLNLLKDVGKKYLGEEDVDMVQQTRIKETKEGQFKAISYKVSGKSGSVTLDPNGQVIATRKPVSDDYSRRQETVNTLVKEQDTLLKDILKKEKQIGVARADGFDSLAETLSKQVEEKQKLYDENKQSLKEMGEEEVLQQQLIKEVADRKKQEEEINEIISRRNDKARKAEEAKAEKDRQKLDKQIKDYVSKIEKQNLSLDDQALAQITNANVGVSKPEGYYDYKKYTEGDKWVGALTGADDLINKYKELLQAEKKLDEVTKNYEKTPETYAQAWQDAKDNVSALTGEVRDLVKVTSLDSLSSDQMAKWTEIDEAMEEVRRKRDAKVEEKTTKDELKERQKNEELALRYHLQALEEESKAEKKAYNDKMARRQEWLKNAQKETAERAKQPTFKDKWDEELKRINSQQENELTKTLQSKINNVVGVRNTGLFDAYHDKKGNWTGALADEAMSEAKNEAEITSRFDLLISKYKELENAEKELNNQRKRFKTAPSTYRDTLQQATDDVSRIKGEIRTLQNTFDSFTDQQVEALDKAQQSVVKIAQLPEAEKETQQMKVAYDELGEKVKEYLSLRREIARGKGLAGDDVKAKQLKDDIDNLNDSIIKNGLYNGDLESKALKGLDTIDTEVTRIEAKLQDASQKKLFENYEKQKSKLESAKFDLQFEIDNGNHTDAFIQELKSKILDIDKIIADINSKPLDAVTDTDIKNALDLLEEVRRIRKEGNLTANRKANENSLQKNLTQVNSILSENTKMSFRKTDVYKDFVKLQSLFKNFDTKQPQEELAKLTTQLLKTKAEFEDLDESVKGKGFFSLFSERLRGINAQFLAQYFSWQDFIRYGRTAVSTIIDLDTQLVDLRKTTKMNNDELREFYRNSNDVAKQMGVTTSEIISQAAAWSRLGFNTKEQSTEMAKLSSMFTSISPGMDTESSTDYLVSTIQAYGLKVDEVQRKVLDNVNAVGNAFATTNAEIGEMLTRSSAAMKEANNSLEQTIALETAAVEITRNAERTGTAFRTVSMRIRGYDEESEDGELLEDYEELKGKIADLTKTAKTPGGISLFTDETKQTYKSTYQLLKEISEIYHDLTDKEQAGLLEALAGKRGGQVLAPILSDFSQVDKAMETMKGAAGSAEKEMDIIRDSLEFKINEIKQTWVGVLQDIADRGGLGEILDGLNKISSVLGDIVSSAGLIRTAFVGLATFVGSKKLGLFNTKDSGTLLGAIAQTHNTKKELSGYEDDIDTYKKVIEHLQQSSDSKAFFNMDIDSMENTSDRVKEKLKEIKDIADETKGSSSDIIECINDEIGNVETSIDEISKKTTALGNSIKGFFKGLLNGLISMGASMLLSWGISEGIKAIDKLINKSKYIQQAAKKARDAIASIKTELDNTSKSVDETKQRYAELAQEVNHLGSVAQSQGTLSNDEYKEFLDLSNQLSELFPTLTQGYDDNGNAILKLSGDVDTIVGSLERLVEVEREAANAEIGKKMPKVWAGFVDDIENETAKLYGSEEHLKGIREQNFSISSGKITNYDQRFGYLGEAANIAGVKINLDDIYDNFETTGEIDLSFLEIEDREKLAAAFKVIENNWDRQVRSHEAIIESKSKEMYDNLITQFVDDDNYKNLTEEQQKVFNGMLLNIDYKKLVKDFGDNYEAAFNEIQTQINTIMDKMPEGSDNQKKFQDYYEKIFSIDTSEGVFAENIEQIKQYIQELADLLGIEYIDLAEIFGFSDIDADLKSVKDRFITNTSSSESNLGYISFDPRKQKAEQEAKKEYEAFVDSLSKEDFDFWKNALNDGKIPQDVLHRGEQGLKDYLEELREIANKNPIFSATSYVDNMKDVRSAVGSLNDLYWKTVEKNPDTTYDESNIFGIADSDMIESVESAFGGFGEDSKVTKALKNFEDTLVRFPGDSERAHEAMNELVTAYIDQTGILDDLTEATAKQAEAELTEIGITNAHDVVQDRLNKTDKETIKLYSKLKDGVNAYYKAIENGGNGVNELQDIADKLNEVYTFQDADGNNIQLFNVDNVKENIDLINEGLDETCDHMTEIEKLAIQEYLLKVSSEFEDEETRNKINQLSADIDNMDLGTVEIGATMNTGPVVAALNEIYKTGKYTFEEFSKMISTITGGKLKANIKWNTSAINSVMKYFKGNTVKGREFINSHMDEFMIPDEISYTYMGGGSGTTANYAPPASSGSSSGGGGGGGGSEPTQPKEEAEESFDWIEVAIQRIEEQITRLDKVVGNSYTLWGNRNKALADELDEITKKIEAEGIAQQEYLRNADKVQVNNGKGLNDDDYGENDELVKARDQELLDAAKKAWATGEYQRKVREGQMSGDDIEKIQNHFLADTIKEYQELYNKAVQAGDAVYDAMLERAGKYEERFNMVKDEYAELIQYVTDAADVIDEKINRTEKHGYFVSKSYYEQLKELEAQHGTYLQNEYNELVKKRDEAVSSGAIEEGSSAWNKMNQEINSVNLELEQHLTKMLEYNNTIRQLDWDFFDWVEERISRINDEASFLVDLMSNDKLYEDNGFLNNLGHATNAMYAAQYEVYMRQAKDYANERLKLEKEIAKDPANKDLIARYEELVDAQQDAIKGAEQMKDSVKSLVQEGINLYLQSLQKLIDKYKESLSDAKDLYSYQQNIAEQTKNIGNLRKQLTAYEGDDSEETRATVQKLRTQLEDAETKLKETEWDRYISETESFLSDMYTDMEETLNARLDDIDLLMHDMIDVANENSATVQDTIRTETDKVGYTLTSYFDGIVNGGSVLTTDLNNGFAQISGLMTNVLSVIEQIKNYAATMVDNGKTKVESTKTTTVNTNTPTAPKATGNTTTTTSNNNKPATNTTNNNSKPATNTTTNNNKPARSETDYYGVALAIINGNYGWGNGDNRVSRLKQKGFDATKVQDLVNKIWNEGYIFSGAWVGRYQGITDLSKYSYNKYAKGSKRISHDQMAITQEKGAEMIFRNDDGSLLMPLGTGDKVFTAQMTDNLWELAKGKFTTNIPKTGGGNTINNSNAINITLPNVTNYEQFKTQLQNDPKMTSFIQQITLGEVSNGIKLNKRKY